MNAESDVPIEQDWVRRFVDALHTLEDRGDAGPMVEQFAPEGSVWNLAQTHPRSGTDEVRHFWENYRAEFQTIHSTFERVIENEEQAALEWHAQGTLAQGGREVAYRGVTLIRKGQGGITQFAGYYDQRPFLEALGAQPVVGRLEQQRIAA